MHLWAELICAADDTPYRQICTGKLVLRYKIFQILVATLYL